MQKGQTVVVVVLALVALLAVAGLALDGTNIYRARRILQNAADKGALGGSLFIAMNKGVTTITRQQVWNEVSRYVQMNGGNPQTAVAYLVVNEDCDGRADEDRVDGVDNDSDGRIDEDPTSVGNPLLQLDANTVRQTGNLTIDRSVEGVWCSTRGTIQVLFGGFLMKPEETVQAQARADIRAVGVVPPGQGVAPIAVHYEIVRRAQRGDILTVWDGYSYQATLQQGNQSTNYGEPANPYAGWLNLEWIHNAERDHIENREVDQSPGTNELRQWIRDGSPFSIYAGPISLPPNPPSTQGDFIFGEPGIRAAALHELRNYVGRTFIFVVYDRWHDRNSLNQMFPNHGSFPQKTFYHAIGFVAVRLTEVRSSGNPKYVRGSFEYFTTGGSMIPGAGIACDDMMARTVVLVE
ncbi:MAG: pilus assembly protein TadG-related protein [Armatimonadetes bacterium]|nr:pilus assembly protein TadG-related protein [Armatimonadota bacterium]MDW8121467.1 pilus assembly protein TadG-related protein [Armatimonadota bacterium]